MIKGNIKITNNITPKLNVMQKKLQNLPEEAYKVFVKETPVRKGNARRNTKLKNKQIQANYPYAKKLDEGYSQQSPKGMTEPTTEFIKKKFVQIITGK